MNLSKAQWAVLTWFKNPRKDNKAAFRWTTVMALQRQGLIAPKHTHGPLSITPAGLAYLAEMEKGK